MNLLEQLIPAFLVLPALGFVASLLLDGKRERALSALAYGTVGLQLALVLGYSAWWLASGAPHIDVREVVLYSNPHYEFFLDLYFDGIGATYMAIGALLTFLITVYSRYYLHREQGFKRFFNTILLFYLGFCVTVLGGNFETLFVGWEVLGISSFLLIAFYRDRYVKHEGRWKIRYSQFHRLYEMVGELPPRENIQAHYLATHGYKHPGTDPLPPFPKVKSYKHETGVMPPFLDTK